MLPYWPSKQMGYRMCTSPYFTHDGRYLIYQRDDFVRVVDFIVHRLLLQIEAQPIGISKDDSLLLLRTDNKTNPTFLIYSLHDGKEIPLADVESQRFAVHQRVYLSDYVRDKALTRTRRVQKWLVFSDVFDQNVGLRLPYGAQYDGVSEEMHPLSGIYKTLGSPYVAFRGLWETDWGGYDSVWTANLETGEYFDNGSFLSEAHLTVNYTWATQQITVSAAHGIELIDVKKAETEIVRKSLLGKQKTAYADVVAHGTRIVCAQHNEWHSLTRIAEDSWKDGDKHTIEKEIRALAIHPNGEQLAVITDDDLRVYPLPKHA